MNKKIKLYPDVRFMNYSNSWKQLKLGDFVTISGEKRNIRNEQDIHYSIEMNNIESSTGRLISKTKTDKLKGVRNFFDKNQVLFAKLRPYLQKYYYSEQEGVCSTEFWVFDGSSEIHNLYLYYLVQTPKFIQSANVSSGTKMPRADWSYMKTVSYYIPSLEEQEKIGTFLSVIDHQINLKERKINKLQKIKKSYLSEMFPENNELIPRRRFKGFTKSWQNFMLDDLANNYDNLRVPVTASKRIAGETPYYGANGIQDYVEGFTHEGEYILLAEDGANDLKNYPIHYVNRKIWVNNHAHVLKGKSGILDNKFLMYRLKKVNMVPYLVGGGRAKLNANVMMNIKVLIPELEEQQKIGAFFMNLDKQILAKKEKLEKIKKYKKAFLQKMFT